MTESYTGQDSKNRSGTKNPDRNLPDFFNRQITFNLLHLNHLQQARCCYWCKVKNSESKSQPNLVFDEQDKCCCYWCKVKNSESKSQQIQWYNDYESGCCYWCKVKNSESKSQRNTKRIIITIAVVTGVKLKILKANHNLHLLALLPRRLLLLV